MGILFIISAFELGASGALPLAFIIMVGNLLKPWMSILINKSVADEHRATMISLFGFITRAQFLALGLVVPYLAEIGCLNESLLALGASAAGASALAVYWGRGPRLDPRRT
jgi:hypothetical protein